MRCPSCGYPIDQQNLDRCPQCGYILTSTPGPYSQGNTSPSGYGYPPQSGDPGSAGGYTPLQQPANPYGNYGEYGNAAPPSGYGTPPQDPSAPYGPYASYGQGQYGQPAPPSGYGQRPTYGQAAPPSYPMVGYPQAGYTQPGYSPPPQRKSRTGLIIGIIVAVVVVLVACTGGTIFALRSLTLTGAATLSGTPAPSATPTLSASKVYNNTFSSDAEGWTNIPQHCFLASDGYHAAGGYYWTVPVVEQDNVDISVKVQQVSGPTTWSYGLLFRQQDKDNNYAFMIDGIGDWVFGKCVNADCTTPIYFTANNAIKTGLGVINTIEVRATGPHFVFFVNGVSVGDIDDTALAFGKISLIASGKTIDCAFTDLVITRPD